ncbi:MAG: hypothetical protein II935_09750, partial [Bacteroidales bacterium]|nr:hypothetical protein [Bacteroidales bacterium]
ILLFGQPPQYATKTGIRQREIPQCCLPLRPKVLKNLKGVKLGQKRAVMCVEKFSALRKKIVNRKSQIANNFYLCFPKFYSR